MLTAALVLAASVMIAGSDEPEGVVSTAPKGVQSVAADAAAPEVTASPSVSLDSQTPHGLTTAQQIDRWVGASDVVRRPAGQDPFAFSRDDRKMHGEVFGAMGTGDYSAFGGRVSIPLGETGRLDLSYSQSKNSPWGYGYGYGYPGGYDPRFGSSYRGHYEPFFAGEGVIMPGLGYRPWRAEEGAWFGTPTRAAAESDTGKADED